MVAVARSLGLRAVLVAVAMAAVAGSAIAQTAVQVGPGSIGSGRDCRNVKFCNFTRAGVARGCTTTYACRVCRFVDAPCTISGTERICRRAQCTWG